MMLIDLRWFLNNTYFKKIIYGRIKIKFLKISMKNIYLNSILFFQKYYQSLKYSKSSKLFFKKFYLYIVSYFINKKNKIAKFAKYDVDIFILFNISIY